MNQKSTETDETKIYWNGWNKNVLILLITASSKYINGYNIILYCHIRYLFSLRSPKGGGGGLNTFLFRPEKLGMVGWKLVNSIMWFKNSPRFRFLESNPKLMNSITRDWKVFLCWDLDCIRMERWALEWMMGSGWNDGI